MVAAPSGRPYPRTLSRIHCFGIRLLERDCGSLENFPPISFSFPSWRPSQEVLEFGRLKHRCDRADFHDWLEVLEFLGYLQTFVLDDVKPEVVECITRELAVVVSANIQFWRASIEKEWCMQLSSLLACMPHLRGFTVDPGIRMKTAIIRWRGRSRFK